LPDDAIFRNPDMKEKPTYEELERRVHELKTDNTQLENKLLEVRSFTEEIMTYMTEGLVLADTRGTVIFINQRLSEMLGYLPEEITGKCWLDMISVEQQVIAQEEEARRAVGHIDRYEIVLRRKNGEEFSVLICAGPRFNKQSGQYIGSMAVVNDITERKLAEQRLQRQTFLFQNLFKNSPDAIAVLDHEDRVLEINRSFETLFGYSHTEAQGQEINDLLAPEPYRSDAQSVSEKVIGDVQVVEREPIRCTKGGRPVEVSLIGYPLVVDQQKIGAYAIYRDITERKRTEEALVRQQRSIQLNNRIANVFLTSSREKVFADVLDVVLKALESRFGYFGYIDEAGDLISPSLTRDVWDQCQVPDKSIVFHRSSWGGLYGRSLLEKQTLIANENLHVPGGHVALESALATPIVYNDILVGQFVVANKAGGYDRDDRDLLESVAAQTAPILFAIQEEARREILHEKLESQLRQAQKMESVGRLAGGIAHDFNNMLGVILGHTEMALQETDPASPLYANLHSVHQAGERSADLTRQLLAFARKQTIAPKVIDINDTVDGMLNMLRRLIGEDLDLLWQPGRNLQPVKIDPSQIDQLLANLCVNARDAIDGVGKITIATDAKSFDEEYCTDHLGALPGEYILLEVSDDGCGMDQKTLSQICEPFFTTKEQGQGTGLGLASIYGMVKQNNGFINVYSEPNQGTNFKIYLPVHAIKPDGVMEKALVLPTERGNETILLVEDESAILEMTTTMLEGLGYTVVAAATPGEAIRLAHEYQGRVDLLMTDVVMPEMNGRELAGNLLSNYPNLKRLFMSGYTANVIAHHGVLDQGVHFIQKPFSKKDLGEKLREALAG